MQSLEPLKTRAKGGQGRTYWIYSTDKGSDFYKRKHILDLRPSVTLAKNIKRKDHANKYTIHATTFELILLFKTVNAADF